MKECSDFSKLRLGSPWSAEDRAVLADVDAWLKGLKSRKLPPDPLRSFGMYEKAKKLISIRIPAWMLDLVKEVARQHDFPYQHVMRLYVEQGLRRAVREGAAARKRRVSRRSRS